MPDTAAAPVVEKYKDVLAVADVFTASTALCVKSIRLELGYASSCIREQREVESYGVPVSMRCGRNDVYPVVDAIGGTSVEAHRAGLEHVVQAGGQPIDATNDFDSTSLEGRKLRLVADLMSGARVVKAANTTARPALPSSRSISSSPNCRVTG
jgi:hypothetical protein